ncbi:hypothetical protein [Novosphingobium sp. HII-3]|uniref:hypothetical protein n=1 Tax=Novosphingobium sp. HII-3 TaxID=2075565 RepID=UPI001304E5AB|nr:hypothetical protein [Novosphingobium sp. HII-3]
MTDRKKRLHRGGYTGPGKPYIIGEQCHCRFGEIVVRPNLSIGPRAPDRTDIIG